MVTIKQIAERTGLSIPTVGNILGRAAQRYSPQTREKVHKACKDLGYMPNASAKAVRQGRFDCAALVLSRSHQRTHSYIPIGLLDGIDDELSQHGMHLTVSRLSDEELSRHDFLPKVLRESMADGMIVNYTHEIPQAMLNLVHAQHAPAVWVNAQIPEDCVFPDDLGAARAVTEEMIKLGHRRIALVHMIARLGREGAFAKHWQGLHYSVRDRDEGYAKVMKRRGLVPRVLSHGEFIEESEQVDRCRALLSAKDRPTAVICYSENETYSLIGAARSLGLSIPKDLSVVTFAPASMWVLGYEVSIAAVPTEEVGRRAVRMLLEKISHPARSHKPEAVGFGLLRCQTLGKAPPI